MPVKRVKPEPESHADLVQELVRVLKKNSLEGPPDEPNVIIEEIPHSRSLHVTVIWKGWRNLEHQERGRIILSAIGEALGEEQMLRVTMAMGLTEQEAARLGIMESLSNPADGN